MDDVVQALLQFGEQTGSSSLSTGKGLKIAIHEAGNLAQKLLSSCNFLLKLLNELGIHAFNSLGPVHNGNQFVSQLISGVSSVSQNGGIDLGISLGVGLVGILNDPFAEFLGLSLEGFHVHVRLCSECSGDHGENHRDHEHDRHQFLLHIVSPSHKIVSI